jgi:hypothetical protein
MEVQSIPVGTIKTARHSQQLQMTQNPRLKGSTVAYDLYWLLLMDDIRQHEVIWMLIHDSIRTKDAYILTSTDRRHHVFPWT